MAVHWEPKQDGPATFDLLVEDASRAGCMGHIPALPGLCFRAATTVEVERVAPARIVDYARWLVAEDLADLEPEATALAGRVRAQDESRVRVVVAEHVAGAPVWESGNAAALFERDLHPLTDDAVCGHLRLVRRILERVREATSPLSAAQRARRPAPDRRSIDETLTHIGNCVWWYCSRIDDALPEPEEPPGEDPLDRIDRLSTAANAHLLAVPFSQRAGVHVVTRFPTKDPHERWTHTKVCRRQAEHAWEHLPGLQAASEAASRRKTSTNGSTAE